MWLYRVTAVLRPFVERYWTLHLDGEVDAIPETGPLILAGNHTSFLDPFVLGFMIPRPIRFLITRDWYDKNPAWRFIFRGWNALPVESGLEGSVASVCASLEKGDVVGIYPEGRISYDGRIKRFRSGICYFAARSGAPVLPLGIRGLFESLPRTRRIPRRAEIRVSVGAPMRFPGSPCATRPGRRSIERFRQELFHEVCRLSGQESPRASAASAASLEIPLEASPMLCPDSHGRSSTR